MAFKPGQSGNGRGRPKGSRDWRLGLSNSKIAKLKRKLVGMALKGDMRAMQLCADRLWPRIRPQAPPVEVETTSADLASQGAAIIAAGLSGRLAPDILRDLLSALADQARLVEFTEIENLLQKLENQKDTPPPWAQKQDHEKLPIRKRRPKREKTT